MEFALLASIALNGGLAMGFSHYWLRVWCGDDVEPPKTYIWGVGLGILVPFITWLVLYGLFVSPTLTPLNGAIGFLACCASAGFFTVLAYATDQRHSQRQELRQRRKDGGRC